MSELAETIERVVREVLARMGHAASSGPAPAGDAAPPPTVPPVDDSLSLDRRVVTLADLPERLKAVRRLVVPCGAVVTPAVRDVLQQHRIALVFGRSSPPEVRAVRAVLAVAASGYDPAPLTSALWREGYDVESHRHDCLIRGIDQLAGEVKSGDRMAILATDHPAPALCLANRHAGVRAVLGVRADRVAAEAQSVGANLLVVDPTTTGFFVLKQLASQFLRGGPKPCPKVFQERLA